MAEYIDEEVNTNEEANSAYRKVPAKISPWSQFKGVLFHEIKVELTPRQENFFAGVKDFWTQDVTWESLKSIFVDDFEEPKVNV